MQGAYHGQQVFVADVGPAGILNILELDRSAGWRKHTSVAWSLTAASLVEELANTLFESSADHIHADHLLIEAPFRCEIFQQTCIVIEMSRLPGIWVGEMKQLVDTLSC